MAIARILSIVLTSIVGGIDPVGVKFEGNLQGTRVTLSVVNSAGREIALIRGRGYYVKAFDSKGVQITYPRYRREVGVYYARPVERDWLMLASGQRTSWHVPIEMREGKKLQDAATILIVRDKEISLDGTGETMGTWIVPSFVKKSKARMIKYPDSVIVRKRKGNAL